MKKLNKKPEIPQKMSQKRMSQVERIASHFKPSKFSLPSVPVQKKVLREREKERKREKEREQGRSP